MASPVSPVLEPNYKPTPPVTVSAVAPSRTSGPRVLFRVRAWEPLLIFLVSFLVLALFTPRVTTYLDPTTGDEPFYLMTAISILKDGDLNECNNYTQHDELAIYPPGAGFGSNGQGFVNFPPNWVGWRGAPLPCLPILPSFRLPAGSVPATMVLAPSPTPPVSFIPSTASASA